jgi:hypothetical protein
MPASLLVGSQTKTKSPSSPTGREAESTEPSWCHPTLSNTSRLWRWRHYSSFRVRTGGLAMQSIPCHDNGWLFRRVPTGSGTCCLQRSARGSQVHSAIASVSVLTWPDSLFCTPSLTFPARRLALFSNGRSKYNVVSCRSQASVSVRYPTAQAGGLWPDSTATQRTFAGALLWLRRPSHQGHLTTAPLPSSLAG